MKYTMAIASGLLLLASCQKKEEKTETVTEDTTVKAAPAEPAIDGETCFLNVVSKDSTLLSVNRQGDSVSGTFRWLPYEKDKKTIVYKGTISGTTVTATGTSQAEGMTNREELIFTLEDNQASVKFGEMIEGDDGVWRYKNKNTASIQVLAKADCK
jgi:hypothetical protein